MHAQKIVFISWISIFFASLQAIAPTIFAPRQLSYNPIFENAQILNFHSGNLYDSDRIIFSAKPIFTQNVGTKFSQYFTIDNKPVLNVQENGSGDISSAWFIVFSPIGSFYSSQLSFNPKRTTFGTMLYTLGNISDHVSASIHTALLGTRNTIQMLETAIDNPATTPGLQTVGQVLGNTNTLLYGAIGGVQTKYGVDDIQLKLIYHSYVSNSKNIDESKNFVWQAYLLAGIPTGDGSKARYLFEPLIGSTHAQIGIGGNMQYAYENLKLSAEAKWRYAFSGDEIRSFDLAENGQWSRYMQIVNSLSPTSLIQAINNLTFPCQVTPQNSFDLFCAAHYDLHESCRLEIGYDFWVRQAEKISVTPVFPAPSIGIADLDNLYPLASNPTSASGANISQSPILPNLAPSDSPAFIPIIASDINTLSAAAPQSISNSIYGSIAYKKEFSRHALHTGLVVVYECGHGINVPNNVSVMLTLDLLF